MGQIVRMTSNDSPHRDGAVPSVPDMTPARQGRETGTTTEQERRADLARRTIDRRVRAVVEGMSDAFLALDPQWRVTYANREAARLNGVRAEDLVGKDHWTMWPETRGSEVERQYRRVVAEHVPVQFEHHYPIDDVWHDIRAYPSDDGGVAVFYRDVTEQKRLEHERERQTRELAEAHEQAITVETRFRLLVDRVRDYGIFFMDPDGRVTHWGPGAERMTGWPAEEIIGRHLRALFPPGGMSDDGSAEAQLQQGAQHGEYIGEGERLRRDGTTFPAHVVLTALRRGTQLIGFSTIMQDLTAEREREAALAHAFAAAEAANTAKSQFLANTSHEIRTPLNAIVGYAELLEIGMAGPLGEQQRHYVSRIQSASRHLLGLVNDVLDMSKIEAGQMRAAREPSLVSDAVSAALALVEPQARTRGLIVSNACGTAPHAYRGDGERVRQILANLLANAVRFTEPGGRITVSCGSSATAPADAQVAVRDGANGWTYVRVEDTGVGIPADQLERIWSAFVQVDPTRTRRFGGSGLGLTISRHLARLMGGDITVHSEPGLGSAFVVWLPAATLADLTASQRAADDSDALRGPGSPPPSPQEALATTPADEAVQLSDVADAILAEADRILASYVARLRTDPETPRAADSSESQLEDHATTLIAEIAQALGIVADDGAVASEMLRDGRVIRQLIAARHGVQRARLGWSEAAVRRDYQILHQELHAAVERRLARAAGPEVARALGVINYVLERAVDESVKAFLGEV
jgi:PAS domain S-box-containing protein